MTSLLLISLILVAKLSGEGVLSSSIYIHHLVPEPWTDAVMKCKLEGGILVSPTTPELTDVLTSSLAEQRKAADQPFHTGYHDSYYRGVFLSYEGVPLTDSGAKKVLWYSMSHSEPNSLVIYRNGTLRAVPRAQAYAFVCRVEKKAHTSKQNECGTTANGYSLDSRTGSCYKFHHRQLYWSEAFLTCAEEGAHLVIVNSVVEAQVIRELFVKNKGYPETNQKKVAFAGFTVWSDRKWLTIHGQTLTEAGYDVFAPGEPNNLDNKEYCGTVGATGTLWDDPCDQKIVFICEKPLTPEHTD